MHIKGGMTARENTEIFLSAKLSASCSGCL